MRLAVLLLALLLAMGCGRARRIDPPPPTAEPQYGGTLNVATVYRTLSALSWDPADWAWKTNHDVGSIYEQLFAADLDQAVGKGGSERFLVEAFLPEGVRRGELAESWQWLDDLTLEVVLRRDALIVPKPGLLDEPRPIDAYDVVDSYERTRDSPKRISTYYEHIDSVEATGDFTVVFRFNRYNAEWAYRFGYGFYSSIVPREVGAADTQDWRNATGSGPFMLDEYIQGNLQSYARNDLYWGEETLRGTNWKIPFVDRVNYRVIKDEATQLSALRTGKIDIAEVVRWIAVDHLEKSTPELRWSRSLANVGTMIALRTDQKPFDDRRVRRALNLAVNHQEIVDVFLGGNGEVFNYPMSPAFGDYFQPLDQLPEEAQILFDYRPEEARELLAEAGYPDGLSFTMQTCSCNPAHVDLAPLLVSYLEEVGVEMEIQTLEYAAFLSSMTTQTHTAGYLFDSGHTNPTTSLRKNFLSSSIWNPAMWNVAEHDRRLDEILAERDEGR
ncbi:MAG: ABC transporter substrate-binding protein, partial [Acidobacteriota bacterium]